MPEEESILLVQLEKQNRALLNEITSWSIDEDFLTTTDGFEFSCFHPDPSVVRGLALEPIEIKLNGHSQMLARIERSRIGQKGGAITYSGRDYLSAAVTCSIDPRVEITEEMDLFTAFTAITAPIGIDTVYSTGDLALRNIRSGKSIAGGAGRDFKSLKAEEIKPNHGASMMGYLSRIAARHGGTIQPADTRNAIRIAEPDYSQSPVGKLQRLNGDNSGANNIVRGVAEEDFSDFPTYTQVTGSQARPAQQSIGNYARLAVNAASEIALDILGVDALAAGVFSTGNGGRKGRINGGYDTGFAAMGFAPSAEEIIREHCHTGRLLPKDGAADPLKLYRLLAIRDKTCRNQEQVDRLAVREVGERFKSLLTYEVEVQGHTDHNSGAIWAVDTMVDVLDEECDIAEPMWVARRRLSYDPTGGARTNMTLWRPGAFVT